MNRSSDFFNAELVSDAVGRSRTQTDALKLLGQTPHADNFRRLQEACVRYGLQVPGRKRRPSRSEQRHRTSRIRDANLEQFVADAKSMHELCKQIGVAPAGKNYAAILAECAERGIPTGHLANTPALTQAQLREAITARRFGKVLRSARSQRGALSALGLRYGQANFRWLRDEMERHGFPPLPFSDYSDAAMNRLRHGSRIPDDEFFALGVRRNPKSLRLRATEHPQIDHTKCAICGCLPEWNGKPLVFHLDHENGDRTDNRWQNLRFLCPNCHSQTDTYCRRNAKVRRGGLEPNQPDD